MTVKVLPTGEELVAARRVVDQALSEDLNDAGDLTSQLLISKGRSGTMLFVARQPGVIAGLGFAAMVFDVLDPAVRMSLLVDDGARVAPAKAIAEVTGPVSSLLTGERTALNLLTMLSGTATLTQRFVDAVQGTRAAILDTRKTFPGLRSLQKYAVRCGGGRNHRMGLFDGVLIKDNHLAAWKAAGGTSLAGLLGQVRVAAPAGVPIEIEVDTIEQFKQALAGGPDVILCDNMSPDQLCKAVELRDANAPAVQLEASGGITLETVRRIAETGIDRISVGALTHSAVALDVGCDWR